MSLVYKCKNNAWENLIFQRISTINAKNDFLCRHSQEGTGGCSTAIIYSNEERRLKGELARPKTKAAKRKDVS